MRLRGHNPAPVTEPGGDDSVRCPDARHGASPPREGRPAPAREVGLGGHGRRARDVAQERDLPKYSPSASVLNSRCA
jgi:hypothetical protein